MSIHWMKHQRQTTVEVSISVEEVTTPGACAGDYTRTFTATDDGGNATTATQTITIVDTTAPEFTFVLEDYTAECPDEHPLDEASATDNCGEVSISVEEVTTGRCAGDYTILVRSQRQTTVVTLLLLLRRSRLLIRLLQYSSQRTTECS